MAKMAVIIVVILAVLVLAGLVFTFTNMSGDEQNQEREQSENGLLNNEANSNINTENTNTNVNLQTANNEIRMNSNGFTPQVLEINVGESVTFVNVGNSRIWPATDRHPTHKEYPSSDIEKCGTAEQSMIFDACRGLNSGESYSFTFNIMGTWEYHDHLKPSLTGTIIVS